MGVLQVTTAAWLLMPLLFDGFLASGIRRSSFRDAKSRFEGSQKLEPSRPGLKRSQQGGSVAKQIQWSKNLEAEASAKPVLNRIKPGTNIMANLRIKYNFPAEEREFIPQHAATVGALGERINDGKIPSKEQCDAFLKIFEEYLVKERIKQRFDAKMKDRDLKDEAEKNIDCANNLIEGTHVYTKNYPRTLVTPTWLSFKARLRLNAAFGEKLKLADGHLKAMKTKKE